MNPGPRVVPSLRGVAVSEVTERIKDLVDLLPPDFASEVERMLVRLTQGDDDWQTFSVAAFGALFDESEVEYTEEDVPEGA